ncbi:BglG family transcription antiterminator [Amphibacillus sp. Q70]|uniref:BglG family transcription antiterminator n=1 Tax=Amphibacillus sp. Q70 TaxID=3453416 RepID=UPI003F82D52B
MDSKLVSLLDYMSKQNNPVSGNELAKLFQVSTRTIQNYIKKANHLSSSKLIHSDKNGYLMDKLTYQNYLLNSVPNIPQDNESRSNYLLKRLLTSENNSINTFDLTDDLFISYSTLRNVITYTNQKINIHHLKIISRNNHLIISGTASGKRKLMTSFIQEEASTDILTFENLYSYFPESFVNTVNRFLESFANHNDIKLNKFSKTNLVLHFCSLLNKRYGNNQRADTDFMLDHTFDQHLADELKERISDEFKIDLTDKELSEAYLLLQIYSNLHSNDGGIPDKIKKIVFEIIDNINDLYLIDLNTEKFISPFALHLKKLFYRLDHNKKIRNPLIGHIKRTAPIIYDIATSVAIFINKVFDNIVMTQDEVAFIALHIGAELNRQNDDKEKIRTAIILPEYLSLQTSIISKIKNNFSEDIHLVQLLKNSEHIQTIDESVELLITTYPSSDRDERYETIQISPFFNSDDQAELLEVIDSFRKKKLNRLLCTKFDIFFKEELFYVAEARQFDDEFDVIHFLSNKLIIKDYAPTEFLQNVIEREQMGSTAFGKIAVPHQFFVPSKRNGISVLVSKEGIKWGENIVYIVFLVCIKDEDRQVFGDIYEALLNLFTEDTIFNSYDDICDFQSFKHFIFSHINIL